MNRRSILSLFLLAAVPATSFAAKPTRKQLEFFEKKIRPILVARCYKCHSKNSKKVKGGLLLDSKNGWMSGGESGPAISPGDPKESLFIQAINFDGLEMPPSSKLPANEIALLTSWVKMGAPDPRISTGGAPILRKIDISAGRKFWAFQRPHKTAAPSVKNTQWPINAIDRYVLAKLESKNIQPVRDTDPRTLIRRIYFDLVGLPPSPKVVNEFVSNPQSLAKIVDRLLKSPQFGERWARHWFDVARYAESTGKERNFTFPHAWRYRDYVIRSLNRDKPYDKFIREQVAGDLLPTSTQGRRNELTVATGFLAMGPKSLNERNRQRFHLDVVDEQIDVTTRAVLGITVSCARCHDHKFDPIPTKDYYALAGIFSSTKTFYGIRAGAGNRQPSSLISLQSTGKAKSSVAGRFASVAKNTAKAAADGAKKINRQALQKQVRQLRQKLKQAQRKRQQLAGRAAPKGKKNAKKKKGKGKKKKKKKRRRKRNTKKNTKTKGSAKQIAAVDREIASLRKRVRQLNRQLRGKGKKKKKGRRNRRANIPKGPVAMGVKDGPIADVAVRIRGEFNRQGTMVRRGFLQVVDFASSPEVNRKQSGRLQLADWLTHPDNPLTARVMVNRVWMHLFGQGIVRTTDNFGATGERPSNLPLLDHLAIQFMNQGWSTKKLIRSIVLSRTYRLSSRFNKKNFETDPQNQFNWRANHRRLDAEAIRDAVLVASGQIDLQPRQKSVISEIGSTNIGRNQQQMRKLNAQSKHRSVYLPIVRNLVPGMLRAFDFAEPSMLVGRRDVTTVPRQALFMMNNPFILKQSQLMAQRIIKKETAGDARIVLAFELTYGRQPSPTELVSSRGFVDALRTELKDKATQTSGWSQLCQALFASAEFQCLD